MPREDAWRDELASVVAGTVVTESSALGRYSRDASPYSERPLAAVMPRDTEDVVALVRWARRSRIPLVARGGGSSLDGESVPPRGAVVVDFQGWNAIHEVDAEARLARVGPGLVNRELHRALVPRRLFFPPNPGSWTVSTIGGNVATNASGMRSFRYGATRQWVRGLECVLGTGERLRLGHRARKSSTGPGLLGFLVGSEGTLGLFTEVTVGLAPLPEERVGLVVPLPSELPLGSLAMSLADSALPLSAVEYLDGATARALASDASRRLPPDHALLLLELESPTREVERVLADAEEHLRRLGLGAAAEVFPDADELWTLRGRSGEALDREYRSRLREDVAVPLPRLPELLRSIRTSAEKEGVPVYVYGHLGEGSLHPNYAVDPLSEAGRRLRDELVRTARRLGGTISGEHGIGLAKAEYLALEHGAEGAALLNRLRSTFDPDRILNPGKLYPSGQSPEGGRSAGLSPSATEDARAP